MSPRPRLSNHNILGSKLATFDFHIIYLALSFYFLTLSIFEHRTKGESTIKRSSLKRTVLCLLFALCQCQKTVLKMKWNKKFSAANPILGAGRQRMGISAVWFFLWSGSYLKLRVQQHKSIINMHINQQQVQPNIFSVLAETRGFCLVTWEQ